jgi:predicted ATP-dependent protease
MLKVVDDEGLAPLSLEGMAAILEQSVRQAEYRTRYSARLSRLADLLREADYQARRAGKASIGAEEAAGAVERRSYLSSLPEEKLGQMILSGEIVLAVSGSAVGRVNGLAVHDRGYYAFGMPAVISAQVSPGASGVINIEGESGLSGEIYDKAVLIVEGFLRSRYAREFPLSITASICFEQSYTAVEGDSASSTAVYALLSAIADVPLRQDVAVTGSVNQMGQIQPVGGVTEKVEGFFSICSKAGFTGSQGVMLPRQNVINLTLSRQVQEAVRAGRFHIWAVSSIDEGVAVLTGQDPGQRQHDGSFPKGSFNARVQDSLRSMAELMRRYAS